MICPNCNSEVSNNEKICPACNMVLEEKNDQNADNITKSDKPRWMQAKKNIVALAAIAVLCVIAIGYCGFLVYHENAVREQKYAHINENIDIAAEYFDLAGIRDAEEIETEMSRMYGDWFNIRTNEKMTVSYNKINNRAYAVNYATSTGGSIVINFYFLDEPEAVYELSNSYESFNYIDKHITTLNVCRKKPASLDVHVYSQLSQEEYSDLVELEAEMEPDYTDEEIIQKTFSLFQDKIGGNYSGSGKLYHTSNYSDAMVTYDPQSKTYTCTLNATYSTNAFDFWGTSTQTYFVKAEYLDAGYDLSLLDFMIN